MGFGLFLFLVVMVMELVPSYVLEDSLGVGRALGLFLFGLPASFCKLCSLLRPPRDLGPQDA